MSIVTFAVCFLLFLLHAVAFALNILAAAVVLRLTHNRYTWGKLLLASLYAETIISLVHIFCVIPLIAIDREELTHSYFFQHVPSTVVLIAFVVNVSTSLCFALSRLVAVSYPIAFKLCCTQTRTRILIWVIIVFSVVASTPGMAHDCGVYFDPSRLQWRPKTGSCPNWFFYYWQVFLLSLIGLISIVNVGTCVKLLIRRFELRRSTRRAIIEVTVGFVLRRHSTNSDTQNVVSSLLVQSFAAGFAPLAAHLLNNVVAPLVAPDKWTLFAVTCASTLLACLGNCFAYLLFHKEARTYVWSGARPQKTYASSSVASDNVAARKRSLEAKLACCQNLGNHVMLENHVTAPLAVEEVDGNAQPLEAKVFPHRIYLFELEGDAVEESFL